MESVLKVNTELVRVKSDAVTHRGHSSLPHQPTWVPKATKEAGIIDTGDFFVLPYCIFRTSLGRYVSIRAWNSTVIVFFILLLT